MIFSYHGFPVSSLLKILTLCLISAQGRRYIASEKKVYDRNINDLYRLNENTKARVYFVVYSATVFAYLLFPFIENVLIRIISVSLFSLSSIAAILHRNITGQYAHQRAYFDEDAVEILSREMHYAGDVFKTYKREIVSAALPGAVVLTILLWTPSYNFSINGVFGSACLAFVFGVSVCYVKEYYFCHAKGWPLAFPSPIIIPPRLVAHLFRRERLGEYIESTPIGFRLGEKQFKKIVVIMDESIRGDFTTLGDPSMDTTVSIASLGENLVNFGVALSGHNCSSYSRYMFRFGEKMENLPNSLQNGLNLPGPNIWQFAKSAGYKTIYIDGFARDLRLHSGMNLGEASQIDDYIRIQSAEATAQDTHVAFALNKVLRGSESAFIYVDKYGIHFPYEDRYPAEGAFYQSSPHSSSEDQIKSKYKNALRWNVDRFFETFMHDVDLKDTIIFYTSDHGQSLHEGGYSLSHCSVGPDIVAGEAYVPMAVIAGESLLRAELARASVAMRHRASHFDLFPTILLSLGFKRHDVESVYGTSLLGPPRQQRKFLSGFKKSAQWVNVAE